MAPSDPGSEDNRTRGAVAQQDEHVRPARLTGGDAGILCRDEGVLRRGDRIGVEGSEPTGRSEAPFRGHLHDVGGGVQRGRRVGRAVIAGEGDDLVERRSYDRIAFEDARAGRIGAHHRGRGKGHRADGCAGAPPRPAPCAGRDARPESDQITDL